MINLTYSDHESAPDGARLAAVAHIHQNYTWDIVVERYLALYRRALEMAGKD